MKYQNNRKFPIYVKGVGEVAPGGEFETELPVAMPRVDPATKPKKKETK
jgi:hypothetical protein